MQSTMPAIYDASTTRPLHKNQRHQRQHSLQLCAAKTTTTPTPARSIVILPGLGNAANDYAKLADAMCGMGMYVTTANVARVDWLRNAAGLRDPAYWRGTLQPRPTVDWYLEKIAAAVEDAKRATDGAPVTLLAHSAGGWLGRVYMKDFDRTGIDRMVSLGSPHLPPPPGVVDQTRGILTYCSDACPGAFHPEVQYVTVAGKHIKGAPLTGGGDATWQQRVVGLGYAQVCGDAAVWGDGVVPTVAAHLDGAINLDLEGVYHSPLGSVDVANDDNADDDDDEDSTTDSTSAAGRPWYGSPGVLEQWVGHATGDAAVGEGVPAVGGSSSSSSGAS